MTQDLGVSHTGLRKVLVPEYVTVHTGFSLQWCKGNFHPTMDNYAIMWINKLFISVSCREVVMFALIVNGT
eukprot:c25956_g1_i1 orf=35-247(+)